MVPASAPGTPSTPSMSRSASRLGSTGKPSATSRSRASDWRVVEGRPSGPSSMRMYDQAESRRLAVTRGSIWRSDPGGAVAGVGVQRQARLLAFRVDPRELRLGHVDLAPDLERQRLGEALRDGRDGPQVGGHVLAGRAVATGGALDEPPALVAQGDGETIDLELRDVARRLRLVRRPAAGGRGHRRRAAPPRRRRCPG